MPRDRLPGRRRLLFAAVTLAVCLFAAEAALQVAYRGRRGEWLLLRDDAPSHAGVFDFHPFLGAAPRPGARFALPDGRAVTIGADGTRSLGQQMRGAAPGAPLVCCLGGSSTFGTGVGDGDTWPARLQGALAPDARVTNLGVPGYSSVENLVQTVLLVPELAPRICVYYAGWNDARNQHVPGLRADYAAFHGRSQLANLAVIPHAETGRRSALLHYAAHVVPLLRQGDPYARLRPPDLLALDPVDIVDAHALEIYRQHLRSIVAACRQAGAVPVLVPQAMDYRPLEEAPDDRSAWAPRIRNGRVRAVMDAYNRALIEVCAQEQAACVASVLDHPWQPGDFLDAVHFSPRGNEAFAALLAPEVRRLLGADGPQPRRNE